MLSTEAFYRLLAYQGRSSEAQLYSDTVCNAYDDTVYTDIMT